MTDEELIKKIKFAQESGKRQVQAQQLLTTILVGYSPQFVIEFPELDIMHVFLTFCGNKGEHDIPDFTYKLKLNDKTATWVGGSHPWGGKSRDFDIVFLEELLV